VRPQRLLEFLRQSKEELVEERDGIGAGVPAPRALDHRGGRSLPASCRPAALGHPLQQCPAQHRNATGDHGSGAPRKTHHQRTARTHARPEEDDVLIPDPELGDRLLDDLDSGLQAE
jgi:hypothetical protein